MPIVTHLLPHHVVTLRTNLVIRNTATGKLVAQLIAGDYQTDIEVERQLFDATLSDEWQTSGMRKRDYVEGPFIDITIKLKVRKSALILFA